jgi:nicotinamide riboside kinase
MKRFAFTGPESCGKTTIAKRFATQIEGSYVQEFAREYLEARNGEYSAEDLVNIARGQSARWEESSGILVADTEMLVLKLWSEVRFGQTDTFIDQALNTQHFDHYFLCSPDIPWEPDPLREHPEQRHELFALYHEKLLALNFPFTVLKGSVEERLKTCMTVFEATV